MNRKILVIDDEDNVREMIADVLSLAEFDVITASDGVEGLEKVYNEYPDLVIVDCAMVNMDGYEFVARVRDDFRIAKVPIIMLTVKSSEYDEIKGLKVGVDDYITKPFRPAVLIARVKSLLERKETDLSINPLTHLPGNISIKKEVEYRINQQKLFVIGYVDIAHFKSFNDKYGFIRGDGAIRTTSVIISRALSKFYSSENFVGHIGGDDFVFLTTPELYENVCKFIISEFDKEILKLYDQEDIEKGYIEVLNRQGELQKFPIMQVIIVVINTAVTKIQHYAKISEISAQLKTEAKKYNRSIFIVERRRE